MREFYSEDLFKQWGTSPTLEYGQSKEPQVFENAVITPHGCYDSNRDLIEISQHKRGRNLVLFQLNLIQRNSTEDLLSKWKVHITLTMQTLDIGDIFLQKLLQEYNTFMEILWMFM